MAFGVYVKLWLSLLQEFILSMLKALDVKAFIAFLAILKVDRLLPCLGLLPIQAEILCTCQLVSQEGRER